MWRRIDIDLIKEYVTTERFEFYRHALTEAKKDGIEPEDVVYLLLTGKIIEAYPERERGPRLWKNESRSSGTRSV